MNNQQVYPISQTRGQLGALIDKVGKEKTILITKQGKIKAALIDFEYLKKMQEDLASLYQKTYIDKKLLPYTRIFSDKEIKEWLEEDKL